MIRPVQRSCFILPDHPDVISHYGCIYSIYLKYNKRLVISNPFLLVHGHTPFPSAPPYFVITLPSFTAPLSGLFCKFSYEKRFCTVVSQIFLTSLSQCSHIIHQHVILILLSHRSHNVLTLSAHSSDFALTLYSTNCRLLLNFSHTFLTF